MSTSETSYRIDYGLKTDFSTDKDRTRKEKDESFDSGLKPGQNAMAEAEIFKETLDYTKNLFSKMNIPKNLADPLSDGLWYAEQYMLQPLVDYILRKIQFFLGVEGHQMKEAMKPYDNLVNRRSKGQPDDEQSFLEKHNF